MRLLSCQDRNPGVLVPLMNSFGEFAEASNWPGRDPEFLNFSEEEMLIPDYTVQDLKQLPLRAIAVFTVRCTRRVEHLATGDRPEAEGLVPVVEAAIQTVEDFARGLTFTKHALVNQQIEMGGTPLAENLSKCEPSQR